MNKYNTQTLADKMLGKMTAKHPDAGYSVVELGPKSFAVMTAAELAAHNKPATATDTAATPAVSAAKKSGTKAPVVAKAAPTKVTVFLAGARNKTEYVITDPIVPQKGGEAKERWFKKTDLIGVKDKEVGGVKGVEITALSTVFTSRGIGQLIAKAS